MNNQPTGNEDKTSISFVIKRRGRPATGRTTKIVRVPEDMDVEMAKVMFYEWLPIIESYAEEIESNPNSPRNEKARKLLEEIGMFSI